MGNLGARGKRFVVVVASVVLSAVLSAVPGALSTAQAADPGGGVLANPRETLRWTGSFTDQVGLPAPAACAVMTCDSYTVDVDLPPGTWGVPSPGGIEFAIRWPDEALDLDLFVYGPTGELVAQSDGFFASTGESVLVRTPEDGAYRVVVTPRYTEGTLAYEGIVQVERDPEVEPVRDLTPDLVALPPRNLHFSLGAYLTDPGVPGEAGSCYPEETAEQGARRCLRFDQIIANEGEGPFELRYQLSSIGGSQSLVQRTYRSDGTHWDRVADSFEFHPAHAHFHYKNFAQSFLWSTDGELVRSGRKNGFCMIDVEPTRFGQFGDDVRTYRFPNCNAPTPGQTEMVNGISAGWADVYNWFLADQFMEVSGVAAGEYVLESRADAAATIVEAGAGNNRACSRIRIGEADAAIVTSGVPCPALS